MALLRKKPEGEAGRSNQSSASPKPEPRREKSSAPSSGSRKEGTKVAVIGRTVHVKGELTGSEDIVIEGRIDGAVDIQDHKLTVGKYGRIKADIHAKSVIVVGQVIGNVVADDLIKISPGGSLQGDIQAPRFVLADGARFKGSVDMMSNQEPEPAPAPSLEDKLTQDVAQTYEEQDEHLEDDIDIEDEDAIREAIAREAAARLAATRALSEAMAPRESDSSPVKQP